LGEVIAMSRNTSVTLGEHFEGFISAKIREGRFESKSEAVRAAMRLLEEHEQKVDVLRRALLEGEESGPAIPFNMAEIMNEAKRENG
jgi:antitoxin ParD1/3/4